MPARWGLALEEHSDGEVEGESCIQGRRICVVPKRSSRTKIKLPSRRIDTVVATTGNSDD
jgi:hypothetical protein